MRKIYLLSLFIVFGITLSAQQYGLKDIVDGAYSPKGIKSMVSGF